MTSKPVSCTNSGKSASAPLSRSDIALALGAAGYLLLVLFDGIESPFLSIGLIGLVGYKLVQPHLRNR